jgi:hypothetical protein
MGATMKPIRLLVAALICAALAGCYSSEKPLITDDDSVADYAKLVFTSAEPDNQRSEFAREGQHYVTKGDDRTVHGETLFGYLHMDVAKGQAETWRTYGTDADIQPGMHKCKDSVCIDDLNVYIAYAQKAVAGGDKPDSIFKLDAQK